MIRKVDDDLFFQFSQREPRGKKKKTGGREMATETLVEA